MKELSIPKNRILSIDLLRGLVIILMTLDHTRDYFHMWPGYGPLDVEKTNGFYFFTRWITHFCAPTFVFLSGISIYFSGRRKKDKFDNSKFLFVRGMWLIIVELIIINLAWRFDFGYKWVTLGVIWTIGISMVFMSFITLLKHQWVLAFGIGIIVLHNLLDRTEVGLQSYYKAGEWSFLELFRGLTHFRSVLQFKSGFNLSLLYPFLPWLGVMALGYGIGPVFTQKFLPKERRKILLNLSFGFILLFFFLRATGWYGESKDFITSHGYVSSFFSFLNVTKYPPSLCYTLIFLSIGFLFLAIIETLNFTTNNPIIVLGRVSFFYYALHIFLIHGLALLFAKMTYWSSDWSKLKKGFGGVPSGFGYKLPGVYLVTLLVIGLLLPLCYWYNKFKTNNPQIKLLSYL